VKRLASITVVLLVSACATRAPTATPTSSTASKGAQDWPLLAPATLGHAAQVRQILHAAYQSHTVDLQCVVTVEGEHLTVVGLNTIGLRAFKVTYDGVRIDEQRAPQVPAFVDANRLLEDLQLAFWPLPALQTAFAPAGWTVVEPFAGTRRLLRDDALIAEVHYAGADPWTGRIWLANFRDRYSLSIESSPL
jgi:Protein of unknown function (DUF3261)